MITNTAASARIFLAAWKGRPRLGILLSALEGSETAYHIMSAASARYSVAQVRDQRECVEVLWTALLSEYPQRASARKSPRIY